MGVTDERAGEYWGWVTPEMILALRTSSPIFMAGALGPAILAPKSEGPHATIATEVTFPALASSKTLLRSSTHAREAGFKVSDISDFLILGFTTLDGGPNARRLS